MATPTVRRPAKRCAYAACGRLFRPRFNYRRQRYCCHPCAVAARPRWSRVLAGRKSGLTKARTRPQRMQAARAQAYRRGYADGYEAALRALDPAYAQEVA